MGDARKANVELAGVRLAATSATAWRFQAGTRPYVTTMSAYEKDWKEKLVGKKGEPKDLVVTDSRGKRTVVKDLFILHEVESSKPNIVSFRVADRRWRWHRRLIARTYNLKRKTGDTNLDQQTLPLEGKEGIPLYDYFPYSLIDEDTVWTAQEALKDALEVLEDKLFGGFGGRIIFSGKFPQSRDTPMQDIVLRDNGDTAIERLLALIPGANVWVNKQGHIIVYNQHDLAAAESYLSKLPPATWDGDKSEKVLKGKIRPRKVIVHYEREVECAMHYEDDYDTNSQLTFKRNQMYLENVVQTVDPETTVTEFNPETGKNDPPKTVGPGTWVNFEAWLEAMDKKHGPSVNPGALPWKFNTIKRFWLKGNLEGKLIGSNKRGAMTEDNTNILTAVRALRESFRQHFRISRRYMDRLQQVKAVRVALLDPISGKRMPASVWGQACLVPTTKGTHIASRGNSEKSGLYYNITSLPEEEQQLVKQDPGPQRLEFIDPVAGILRISGMDDPYGTYSAVVPCHVVNTDDKPSVPVRDLELQDDEILGAGMRLQNGTNEEWLRSTLKFKVMITIVPGAPNNRGQFHIEEIGPKELRERTPDYRIQDGTGPDLEVYVSSSEATARFGWRFDEEAEATITKLLGLDEKDPTAGGLIDANGKPLTNLPGFWIVNRNRELYNHSRAVAAEAYTGFADTVVGKVATIVPPNDIELKGNMAGANLQIATAPQGKVNVVHDFAGVTPPVNRVGFMSEGARKVVFGIVRFE